MKLRQGGVWVNLDTYIFQGGQWRYVNFLRDANELLLVISQTTTNLNLQTAFNNAFGSTAWTSTRKKRVIINPGVVVGSTSTVNYALNISASLGGSLTIDNYGSIQGAGGLPNGGTGGNAIIASSPVTFNNQGTIYAGGGAGGAGGTGGTGFYTATTTTQGCAPGAPGCPGGYFETGSATGGCCQTYNFCCGLFNCACVACSQTLKYRYCAANIYTAGGAGGSGGLGQGYNQAVTGGSPGSAGDINAGTGGYGGVGGTWGADGSAGNAGSNGNISAGTGGGAGGLAGFYVVGNGNITWTNLGAVAGRVV